MNYVPLYQIFLNGLGVVFGDTNTVGLQVSICMNNEGGYVLLNEFDDLDHFESTNRVELGARLRRGGRSFTLLLWYAYIYIK